MTAWRGIVAAALVLAGVFALVWSGTARVTRREPTGFASDAALDGPRAPLQTTRHSFYHRPFLFARAVEQRDGGQLAVLGGYDPKAWDEFCLVRRGCRPVGSIAPCESAPTPTWTEVEPLAATMVGHVVRVSGPLVADEVTQTRMQCRRAKGNARPRCSNQAHGAVVLAGAWEPLWLAGLSCDGDDSTICCNAPAFGRTVVAEGVLRPATLEDDDFAVGRWALSNVTLCLPGDDHAPDRP